MNAVLAIEIELVAPVLVDSARSLGNLHPGQIRRVAVRLTAGDQGDDPESTILEAPSDDGRFSLQGLVALAQRSQPEGTAVLVWYQGRSESLVI